MNYEILDIIDEDFLDFIDENIIKVAENTHKGKLTIIAGKRGVGKTSLMVQCAGKQAVNKIPTLIISLEHSVDSIVHRIVYETLALPFDYHTYRAAIASGGLTILEVEQNPHIKTLCNSPLYINDTHFLSIDELKQEIISAIQKDYIEQVWIDYLQLINFHFTNYNYIPNEIISALKEIAEEYNITIIGIAGTQKAATRERERLILHEQAHYFKEQFHAIVKIGEKLTYNIF